MYLYFKFIEDYNFWLVNEQKDDQEHDHKKTMVMDHELVIPRISQGLKPTKDWNQQNNHEMAMDSNSMTMNFKWIQKTLNHKGQLQWSIVWTTSLWLGLIFFKT
jgi:hypothetical protein